MNDNADSTPTKEQFSFQTEVKQLLHLMVHALYAHREVFLRELVSNAADACDKIRFEALKDQSILGDEQDLHIRVTADPEAGTVTIDDNGIGMSREDVIENLGTIAHSGTQEFLQQLTGDARQDAQLIGQFGVGFYAAFIVAERVVVETRRYDQDPGQGVRWESDGSGEYTVETIEREPRGTSVTLHLKADDAEYARPGRVEQILQHYSAHLGFPVQVPAGEDEEGDWRTVNDTRALWTLPKSEISDEDYKAFYQSLTQDFEPPLTWSHNKVEGAQSYTSLLYVPSRAPFDLILNRDERTGLRLYVRRVFIMDAAEELVPHYLRFVRGVVDSDDLPLNISREMLQENELMPKVRSAVVKRTLDILTKLTEDDERYQQFWRQFGTVLKEGVIEDPERREQLLPLLRFESTATDSDKPLTSLDAYLERASDDQDAIWYLTADSAEAARGNPHLEAFDKQGIEVLLLGDRIDEWMVSHLDEYQGKSLKSAARATPPGAEDAREAGEQEQAVLDRLKELLDGEVEAVKPSGRLVDSPACLVLPEHGISPHMQRLLKQAGQEMPAPQATLEVNLDHALFQRLQDLGEGERFEQLGRVLYEQALLAEGGELPDPAGFVNRVNTLLSSESPEAAETKDG